MTALRSPALVAAVSALLALGVHPRLAELRTAQAARVALATLSLLLVTALVARALRGGAAARLVALGAALTLASLGWDAVRGHEGRLRLVPGQASQNYTELGPDGSSLGLRPFGFQAALTELRGSIAILSLGGQDALVTPTQAAGFRGVRIGRPQARFSGDVQRLRLLASDAAGGREIELRPDEATHYADLEIRLEQYFPDFALDAANQPYSRSNEPRQPAALLNVRRGAQAFRVFVLASAPGLHQVEGLGVTFALRDVDAAQELELRVVQAPAAFALLAGVVLAGLGLALGALRPSPPRHAAAPAIALGVVLCGALVALGGGGALSWSWLGNGDVAPVAIPGAGLTLALALVASLGGTLAVGVPALASGSRAPAGTLRFGQRGLILGATLTAIGAAVLLYEAGLAFGTAHEAALLALLAGGVAAAIASADAASIPRAAAAGAWLLLAVVGVASWLQAGGYQTLAVGSAACVALLALAASE